MPACFLLLTDGSCDDCDCKHHMPEDRILDPRFQSCCFGEQMVQLLMADIWCAMSTLYGPAERDDSGL
jgi:hypothetical protein